MKNASDGQPPIEPAKEIRVGISSCLLGDEVRFDGGHKRDRFITDTLSQFVTFVPVCPEMEIGLGSPRESMHLAKVDGEIRLVTTKTHEDLTDRMAGYARTRVAQIEQMKLCGFILKKDSPSCGMERVKVYGPLRTAPAKTGRGLFAAELIARHSDLPIEEEGRLCDPRLRDNFFVRLFAYRRLRFLFDTEWKLGDLVAFHTAEKLLIRAHDPVVYRKLGRLVAVAGQMPREEVEKAYRHDFSSALRKLATTRKVTDVLQHTIGHLRKHIDDASRHELLGLFEDFRGGLVPLVVPLTLLRHHLRHHQISYLQGQTFLEPHPKELMLRNHV